LGPCIWSHCPCWFMTHWLLRRLRHLPQAPLYNSIYSLICILYFCQKGLLIYFLFIIYKRDASRPNYTWIWRSTNTCRYRLRINCKSVSHMIFRPINVIKSNLSNTHIKVIDKSDNRLIQMRRWIPTIKEIVTVELEKLHCHSIKIIPIKSIVKNWHKIWWRRFAKKFMTRFKGIAKRFKADFLILVRQKPRHNWRESWYDFATGNFSIVYETTYCSDILDKRDTIFSRSE